MSNSLPPPSTPPQPVPELSVTDASTAHPFYESLPKPTQSTPIKSNQSSTSVFTSNHIYQDSAFKLANKEMKGKFEEMSTADFLELLPDPTDAEMPAVDHESFTKVAGVTREDNMYNPFVR